MHFPPSLFVTPLTCIFCFASIGIELPFCCPSICLCVSSTSLLERRPHSILSLLLFSVDVSHRLVLFLFFPFLILLTLGVSTVSSSQMRSVSLSLFSPSCSEGRSTSGKGSPSLLFFCCSLFLFCSSLLLSRLHSCYLGGLSSSFAFWQLGGVQKKRRGKSFLVVCSGDVGDTWPRELAIFSQLVGCTYSSWRRVILRPFLGRPSIPQIFLTSFFF